MKLLVDAQLPARCVRWLSELGHEATHTLQLPDGNRTPDAALVAWATEHDAIVVTKDSDFVQHYILTGQPSLLLISTGNISNDELRALILANIAAIEAAFRSARFVELTTTSLVVHR